MKTTMMLLLVFCLCIVNSSLGSEQDCYERLDVISEEHWPALNGFCREILDDTELVAIGPLADSSGVQSTHTVLHTKQNRTYIRGSSSLFHLYGDGEVTRELVEMRGVPVKEIELGGNFIAILGADGRLWTAGSNTDHPLGHHHQSESYPIFTIVEGLPPVRHVAVGWGHCVALLYNNTLVSWGRNGVGELGYDTNSSPYHLVPGSISLGQAATPTDVCCGWAFCTALTSDLEVYTWGTPDYIGRPKSDNMPARVVGIPEDQVITKMTCGDAHTMTLSPEGVLYGWGSNGGRLQHAPNNAPYASRMNLTGMRRSKARSKLGVTGLCARNSPGPVNSPHKWPVTRKMFPFDDVIMSSKNARDVAAGDSLTLVRTYSARAVFFGEYDGVNHQEPHWITQSDFPRDLNAKTAYGQRTMGAVYLGCEGNHSCL